MTGKQRAAKTIELLKAEYPDVKCALIYEKPHELLIATRLSAQCTDKRVNMVTPALFERFPSALHADSHFLARERKLAKRVPVPGIIPAGSHVHVQSVRHAQPVKLLHEFLKMQHMDGIDDAEISVQFRQGSVAACSGTADIHDVFPVPDEAELHKAAAAFVRGFPDGVGGVVEGE